MKSLAVGGALVCAAVCVAPAMGTAHAAPGEWAAIAYDPDGKTGFPGPGFAVLVNHAGSSAEAVGSVLSQCVSGPGMGGSSAPCEVVAVVHDGCLALVSLDGVANPAAGTGPTIDAAIASTAAGHRVTDVQYADCTY